ncbi:MAG: class I tRNA ligase family protein [bacterium]
MSEENKKSASAMREEKILEFWKENDTFAQTLAKNEGKDPFVFYEGPPTANGKPGIHHLEARAFKDAIPRYKTMQGFNVRRKGGWDTHGLPVELQVEKALGLNSKKAIEEYGIAKFNDKCKESVWQFLDIWEKFTDRIGYWVDQKNPYVTYHNDYIESVWNVVKEVNKKDLLYKDYKIVPWCPRCGTALSSHELAQGYQDDKDLSVTAKFKVVGQVDTFILAWTTTPWTLPGNVALAVGKEIEYALVQTDAGKLWLAKALVEKVAAGSQILETKKGLDLIGLEYEPLYPYLKDNIADDQKAKLEKAFKVYAADFVTTEDGTGVVHTAVMYGADDFELGTKLGLPKQHMVNLDGTFVSYADFLAGRFVKDEDVAVDIIKDLAHRGLLFKKEKYEHSYPHCWRCKTPLIYYARDSWYINVSKPEIKDVMIAENKKINWEPNYIRDGRFGEWLKDIKDWAISRERYWGTPLPIWMTGDGTIEVIGGVDELKSKTKKSGNKYFAMRHGYGQHMEHGGVVSSLDHDSYHLTDEGRSEVAKSAHMLHEKKITKIFCSPLIRTRETARITAEHLGINPDLIVVDNRLREYDFGEFDGKPFKEFVDYRETHAHTYDAKLGGSSLLETKNRFAEFLYDIESKYQNETILIVTHGIFFETVPAALEGADKARSLEILFDYFKNNRIQPAEFREINFVPIPHNENYELDLHKPYIDNVTLLASDGSEMTRVKEVMDVWFDSGAMPFAQDNYPFATKEVAYPADYICEAIDQTRGWFYTLHAVGVLMGKGLAYKNVICLGHILDEKGKKMSKSLGNIVDPWTMIEKYGVDTLRLWMYSVNQPGESKNFDEKTVAELHNKVFNLLYNVLAFYELYRDTELENSHYSNSNNVLDQWIVARLNQLIELSTTNLDNFKLLEPVRAMREFVDDLSTWYVRRSRDRIKDGDKEAKQTLYFVLKNFAKLLAPFAPFAAEDIWQKLKNNSDIQSVHLCDWPKNNEVDISVLEKMQSTRMVVTLGMEARQKEKFPVRQPLQKITITNIELPIDYVELILKDELNIKDVNFVIKEGEEQKVELDTNITPELKKEGEYRELVRAIQDLRKKEGLTPSDVIVLTLPENSKEIVSGFEDELKKTVLAKEITISGDEIQIAKI